MVARRSTPSDSVHVRTASEREKARTHLKELLATPALVRSMVLARDDQGQWTVLVGGMVGADIDEALRVGAFAAEKVQQHEQTSGERSLRFEAPTPAATHHRERPRKITSVGGQLKAPDDEAFMFCAVCSGSRWFVSVSKTTNTAQRLACTQCGNEVQFVALTHRGGGRA